MDNGVSFGFLKQGASCGADIHVQTAARQPACKEMKKVPRKNSNFP